MTRINVYYTGRYSESPIDGMCEYYNAACASTVDRANSDGTGVACVDVPAENVDDFCNDLDKADGIDSYVLRQ